MCTVLDAKENSHKLFELFLNAVKIFPQTEAGIGWLIVTCKMVFGCKHQVLKFNVQMR